MGLLTNLFSATVKVALTPVAIVKDAVNIATGQEADATKDNLKSAADDFMEGFDDLGDGDIL